MKKKTVGADGKLRVVPSKRQSKFTIAGHAVIPTIVQGYPGFDIRFTPQEGFRGEFSKLRIGEYIE